MKISLNHLKNYVDINVPVEELCDRMVMAGFEVESIESAGDNMVNVVAARIVKLEPHTDSDHLQICQMDIGKGEPVQIVTGAQNIKVGEQALPKEVIDAILDEHSRGIGAEQAKYADYDTAGWLKPVVSTYDGC